MAAPYAVRMIKKRYNAQYKDVINMFREGSTAAADALKELLLQERRELAQHGYKYGKIGRYKRIKAAQESNSIF
jgi:hypothetical protein